jgi:hypothetical protein
MPLLCVSLFLPFCGCESLVFFGFFCFSGVGSMLLLLLLLLRFHVLCYVQFPFSAPFGLNNNSSEDIEFLFAVVNKRCLFLGALCPFGLSLGALCETISFLFQFATLT